jgi:radical SAM superfamily enzyme YgiQ (UPF0313 family)
MLAGSEQDIIPLLKYDRPEIVVLYDDDFNYLTKMCLTAMREAAFRMCRLAKESGCTVIVHGSDPTDHAASYLGQGADYVIIGEGEVTLVELVNRLRHKTAAPLSSINGIAYSECGEVARTHRREVLTDLDVLPFPARDLVQTEQYRSLWKRRHGYFSMNMVTTRGCPFHCNWCAKPIYGQVYHSRSPENVVEEMLMLKKDFRPDHIWFCDDIFGLRPGWLERFSEVNGLRQATIPYKCLSRADLLLKDDAIESLARSGCQTVWMGAESGSQRILDAMEKGTTIEQIYRSTRILHDRGIRVGFFLQYGYPGETKEDIELTLAMVKESKPDEIGISVSYPLPGTKFYENVKQDLGEKHNWVDSKDLDLMYAGTYSSDFYRALHTVTHKKFRIWQGMETIHRAFSHPASVADKKVIRRILATGYHAATLPRYLARFHSLANAHSVANEQANRRNPGNI